MTYTFDLCSEPWLPCRARGSPAITSLGIRELFARAHELDELATTSPTETVAITRMLLAILHRAIEGPKTMAGWGELWEARESGLPIDRIEAYLDRWGDRFGLFDEQHPFYQQTEVDPALAAGVNRLYFHQDANETLFEHGSSIDPEPLDPANAARLIVAFQAFTVGGTGSHEPGKTADKYTKAAPLLQAAVAIPRGGSLAETLLLNLHRYDGAAQQPFEFDMERDLPAWERDEPTRAVERLPDGYADLLTWQSRRLQLIPEALPNGRMGVRHAVTMKGYNWPDAFRVWAAETQIAYRENTSGTGSGMLPIGFREDRALWRDSTALTGRAEGRAAPILNWVAGVERYTDMEYVPIDFLGLAANKSKLLFARHEQLVLPLAYLEDNVLLGALDEAINLAEKVGTLVGTARAINLPGDDKPYGNPYRQLAAVLVGGDTKTQTRFIDGLQAGKRYWPRLDAPFRKLLRDLPGDGTADEHGDIGYSEGRAWQAWRQSVRRAAEQAFEETMNEFDQSGHSLRGWANAQRRFRYAIDRLCPEPAAAEEVSA